MSRGRRIPASRLAAAPATEGTLAGTIALDPRTRRRMRLGGRLRPTPGGFPIEADRVFANRPNPNTPRIPAKMNRE